MLHCQYEGSSNTDSEAFQTFVSFNVILTDQPHALRAATADSDHAALTAVLSQYRRVPRAGLLEPLGPRVGYPRCQLWQRPVITLSCCCLFVRSGQQMKA
jgi:hypothetical protein